MRITLLGTGTSTGVPMIGCRCAVCTSADPRDRRLRTSALIESAGGNVLIDAGPICANNCSPRGYGHSMVCCSRTNTKTISGDSMICAPSITACNHPSRYMANNAPSTRSNHATTMRFLKIMETRHAPTCHYHLLPPGTPSLSPI